MKNFLLFICTQLFYSIIVLGQTSSIFQILSPSETNVYASINLNQISNYGLDQYGCAIYDLDMDGLNDILIISDSAVNVYKNLGNLRFSKSENFHILSNKHFATVSIADLNNDGRPEVLFGSLDKNTGVEIYTITRDFTCKKVTSLVFANRLAREFINTQSSIIDYNSDGLLDIYASSWGVNNEAGDFLTTELADDSSSIVTNRLYKNLGNFKFEDVTESAGLGKLGTRQTTYQSFASDINNDGYTDLYLTSDFNIPDFLFLNNRGVFTDVSDSMLKSTSYFSMGVDIADINNDAMPDIFTTDMSRSGNFRQKSKTDQIPYNESRLMMHNKDNMAKQSVKNCLQINNQSTSFSEVSMLGGVSSTDWSWSCHLQDFDNDGKKDIFITNGFPSDLSFDFDLPLYKYSLIKQGFALDAIDSLIRSKNFPLDTVYVNRFFKNNGDLNFTDVTQKWCVDKPALSSGSAYGDLDNDGDLDLLVNNVLDYSKIYKNTIADNKKGNFLRLKLIDTTNHPVFNAKATVFDRGEKQYVEFQPVRGFYSLSEPYMHFGMGSDSLIDSLEIVWPYGGISKKYNIKANQILSIYQYDTLTRNYARKVNSENVFFTKKSIPGLRYTHNENYFNDFSIDPLLPQWYSRGGPYLSQGDLNNDRKQDFLVGGAKNSRTGIFLQNDTLFKTPETSVLYSDSFYEDMAIEIFDANNDGWNDVYIASGGYEVPDGDSTLEHRLYLNDRIGDFKRSYKIPAIRTSSSCVKSCDFDKDGDLDLFVGGRVKSHFYPQIPRSYILQNNDGIFSDKTTHIAIGLDFIGMVTSAVWSDFNNDGWMDLVVTGEYMPVIFYENQKGKLVNITDSCLFNQKMQGMWNTIISADIDEDGNEDYILGNLGQNTKYKATQEYPLELFANDFDDNGSIDILSCYYENRKLYPIKQLKSYKTRINGLSKKFYENKKFALATIQEIFPDSKLDSSIHYKAFELATGILFNEGSNTFTFKPLPKEAQFAPVYGVLSIDFDSDSINDIMIIGNFSYSEIERGSYTALKGYAIKGLGQRRFHSLTNKESGFCVDGNGRDILTIVFNKETLIIATQNDGTMNVFEKSDGTKRN